MKVHLFGMLPSVIECESNLKCIEEGAFPEGRRRKRRILLRFAVGNNVHVTIRKNREDGAEVSFS